MRTSLHHFLRGLRPSVGEGQARCNGWAAEELTPRESRRAHALGPATHAAPARADRPPPSETLPEQPVPRQLVDRRLFRPPIAAKPLPLAVARPLRSSRAGGPIMTKRFCLLLLFLLAA